MAFPLVEVAGGRFEERVFHPSVFLSGEEVLPEMILDSFGKAVKFLSDTFSSQGSVRLFGDYSPRNPLQATSREKQVPFFSTSRWLVSGGGSLGTTGLIIGICRQKAPLYFYVLEGVVVGLLVGVLSAVADGNDPFK